MQLKISKYIDDHAGEMVSLLSKLVAIPSVRGKAEPGFPFGKEPAKVLDEMLTAAEKYGFTVKNHENYMGTIDMDPTKPTTLGVLCHLDVVPEGTGWKNPPYTLTLSGGKLYGRGSADDKGPAVEVLFAMRALRECGYELSQNVRFLVGTDEECGSSDLEYYRKKEALPARVFTPDAEFPVINLEKGHIRAKVVGKTVTEGTKTILSASGGTVVNAVPDRAYATLRGFSKEELTAAAKMLPTGIEMESVWKGDTVDLTVKGVAAHASMPSTGKNAVTALLALLGSLKTEDATASFFATLSEVFRYGETDGKTLGIAMSDDKSGALTFVFSVFHFDGGNFEGCFDIRFPICSSCDAIRVKLEKVLGKAGLSLDEWNGHEPHYVDENSEFVQNLLTAYEEITHRKGTCLAIGGGTYVHEVEGGVAFGAEHAGVDNHIHGADEYLPLEHLILNAKIYAEAILRLCR